MKNRMLQREETQSAMIRENVQASLGVHTDDVYTTKLLGYHDYKCREQGTPYSRHRTELPEPCPEAYLLLVRPILPKRRLTVGMGLEMKCLKLYVPAARRTP